MTCFGSDSRGFKNHNEKYQKSSFFLTKRELLTTSILQEFGDCLQVVEKKSRHIAIISVRIFLVNICKNSHQPENAKTFSFCHAFAAAISNLFASCFLSCKILKQFFVTCSVGSNTQNTVCYKQFDIKQKYDTHFGGILSSPDTKSQKGSPTLRTKTSVRFTN